MDIKKKNNSSNYSLSSSFNAVRMHDLKESSDENDRASTSEDLPEVEFRPSNLLLRRASSGLLQQFNNGSSDSSSISSGKSQLLENRISSDPLPTKLQTFANDTKQFIKRRTKTLKKSASPEPKPLSTTTTDTLGPQETPVKDASGKENDVKEQTPGEVGQEALDQEKDGIILSNDSSAAMGEVSSKLSSNEKDNLKNNNNNGENCDEKKGFFANSTCFDWFLALWRYIFGVLLLVITLFVPLAKFLCGLLWGTYLTALTIPVVLWFYLPVNRKEEDRLRQLANTSAATKVTDDDLLKSGHVLYKGWMNILRGPYDPTTYSIKNTRSVLVRLDRDVVRLSTPKTSVLKQAHWTEQKVDNTFVSQELFNIAGASISLRPKNLARRRWYSRKYPICITFKGDTVLGSAKRTHSDPFIAELPAGHVSEDSDDSDFEDNKSQDSRSCEDNQSQKSSHSRVGKTASVGYLSLEETPDDAVSDISLAREKEKVVRKRKQIFLFARSNREKEQWFHQLRQAAGHHSYIVEHGGDRGWWSESDIKKRNLSQQSWDWVLYTSVHKQFARMMESVSIAEFIEGKDVMLMDLGVQMWKPTARVTTDMVANTENISWANALAARIFLDVSKDHYWIERIKNRVEKKMASIHLPYFIETLKLARLDLGTCTPTITGVYEPTVNEWGLWVDLNIEYPGGIHLMLETKLNLMKLKTETGSVVKQMEESMTNYSDEEVLESPELSSGGEDDDEPLLPFLNKSKQKKENSKKEGTGKKILHIVDKITQSKYFQEATENKFVKKFMQGVSDTPLILMVDVIQLEGTLTINIPTPPSDRIWYGFRCPPKLELRARPKVGDRSLNVSHVTDWIEHKLVLLLEKFLVIPNLDDIIIPLMCGSPLLKNINK